MNKAQGSATSQADVRVYQVVHNVFRLATTRFADATGKLEPSALLPMIGAIARGERHQQHDRPRGDAPHRPRREARPRDAIRVR